MGLDLNKIKECLLGHFSRGEDGCVHEPKYDTKETIVPIADDEPLFGIGNAEQAEKDEAPLQTGSVMVVPLHDGIVDEESKGVVFDDVDPISLVDNTLAGTEEDNKQDAEEQKCDDTISEPKLVSLTVDSIKYYDKLRSQMPTDDLKTILDDVCRNMIENLIMAGCQPINEEPGQFDMSRHRVEPFKLVDEGIRYSKVLRKGIEYKNEVKLLAIVEL